MLSNIWYFGLVSSDLPVGKLVHRELCGEPMVFGRTTSGQVFALRDLCPHRGVPLSEGRICGEELECCYHGWTFNIKGQCTGIPALSEQDTVSLDKIETKAFQLREAQGVIWFWFGEGDGADTPHPVIPDVADTYPRIAHALRFPVNIDHAVVGLVDPAHTPHVHESWWWRRPAKRHSKIKHFEPTSLGFKMTAHDAAKNSTLYRMVGRSPEVDITFALPGVRIERIRAGRNYYCGMTACTPINENTTLTTHLMWWSMPWLTFIKPVVWPFVKSFLAQDQAIFEKQARGLRWQPTLRLNGEPDQQAMWYFKIKNEWDRSARAGSQFVNPLQKATLQWRT